MQDNDIEMYLTHNAGKFVVAVKFIGTLKNNVYKYLTSVLKNVYIAKLVDIVNKYNNTYHSSIKTNSFNAKSSTYTDLGKENNDNESQFKIIDHVRASKYKNIFVKDCIPNWSEELSRD